MTAAIPILIASPTGALRALLLEHFTQAGYHCLEAGTPAECLRLSKSNPHALILDVSSGDAAWSELLSDIQQPPSFARIFLTREATSPPDSLSLKLPLRIRALDQALARALRPVQAATSSSPLLLWPGIALQVHERILLRQSDGATADLTEKECDILLRLLAAEGETITREQLLQAVWGYGDAIDTHTLETHIYRLRNKIKTLTDNDRLIANEVGGYSLRNA